MPKYKGNANSSTKKKYRNTIQNTGELHSVGIPWVFRGYSASIPGQKKKNPAGVDAKNEVTTPCACAASIDAQKTRTQLRARRGWVARCITRTGAGGKGEKQTSARQTDGRGNKRGDDDERENRRDVQERANSGRG